MSHSELQFVAANSALFQRLVSFFMTALKDGLAIVNEAYARLDITIVTLIPTAKQAGFLDHR